MTKDILDILASFETHHTRAAIVMVKQAQAVKNLIYQAPITKELNVTIVDILEGMNDIAEVMDGYKQDLLDFAEMHRAYIVKVDEASKELDNK